MPAALRDISNFTPVRACGQAIQSAAAGGWAPCWYFAVLAGFLVVCGALCDPAVPLGVTSAGVAATSEAGDNDRIEP